MRAPDDFKTGDRVYDPVNEQVYTIRTASPSASLGRLRILAPDEVRALEDEDEVIDVRDGMDCRVKNDEILTDTCDTRATLHDDDIYLTNTFALVSLAERGPVGPKLPLSVKTHDVIYDAEGFVVMEVDKAYSDFDPETVANMIVDAANRPSLDDLKLEIVVTDDMKKVRHMNRHFAHIIIEGDKAVKNKLTRNAKITRLDDDCMMPSYSVREVKGLQEWTVVRAHQSKVMSYHATKEEAVAECRRLRAQDE